MNTLSIAYRRSFFRANEGLFHRCLVASAVTAGLLLLAIGLAPIHKGEVTRIEQLPERFARLIIEKPVETPVRPRREPELSHPVPAAVPAAPPAGRTAPRSRASAAPTTAGATSTIPERGSPGAESGSAGRSRAERAVTSRLASTTAALDRTLAGISSSLGSVRSTAPSSSGERQSHVVGEGRSTEQLGVASTRSVGTGSADVAGSGVRSTWVSVGDLSETHAMGGGGAEAGDGQSGATSNAPSAGTPIGKAPGVYRSHVSLLAVVQRYAAGIQYCYGNELKLDRTSSGKLVVALTVAASGEVLNATVVRNTTGSPRLSSCALSQIREWKFPPVPQGITTFQAPFVLTPPY